MTIGIGAFGPNAGAGVLAGLRVAESTGRGAIGGFVSLAALTEDGRLLRASIQDGGSQALIEQNLPTDILQAPLVGLISSGPNRPEPLSDFIAAEPGVGIVTGHRMPQTRVDQGVALNAMVLAEMKAGAHPQVAIDRVIARYPEMDAGFLACATDGRIGSGSMQSVLARGDQAVGILEARSSTARVGCIHNAIFPFNLISTLTNQVALDTMLRPDTPVGWIKVVAGITLEQGAEAQIHIGLDKAAERILLPKGHFLTGNWSVGLGDKVAVMANGQRIGWLGYEPFMTLKDGQVQDIDGHQEISISLLDSLPFERYRDRSQNA